MSTENNDRKLDERDRKLNERREFLDISFGEAQAAENLLSRLGERFQYAALNNQSVHTELSRDEIKQIRERYWAAILEIAKLMDLLVLFSEREYEVGQHG